MAVVVAAPRRAALPATVVLACHGLPIFVSLGSVPPKQTGLPVFRISGAIA